MEDFYEIFDENMDVVASGFDLKEVKKRAREISTLTFVGQGTRPDGSQYGFIIGKIPTRMGL